MKHFSLFAFFAFFSINSFAQVLLNEVSGNTGNNDGANDGWVELINTSTTSANVGCHVITNGEWVITLPPGTTIPAGGLFTIGCGSAVSPNPTPNSGLNGTNMDYPNLPLNFDVCNPVNAPFVSLRGSGFTIDNASATDGDQIVLFSSNAVILDAVKWGGGATGAADNTAMQTASYNLGSTGTKLPDALSTGSVCFNVATFTLPIITDPIYSNLGPSLLGCNASHIRAMGNAGVSTAAVWQTTEWPNPTKPNNSPIDNLTVTGNLTQCASALVPVTFTYEVFNYQHVEPNTTNSYGKIGSFVSTDGGATLIPWTSVTYNSTTGVTTMSYTFTPVSGTYNYTLVWDEYTGSTISFSGSGSSSGTSAASGTNVTNCYRVQNRTIKIIEPMLLSKTALSCPTDFTPGIVNLGSLVTGGNSLSFELFANAVSQSSNTSGIFNLPTSLAAPITVVVTDASGCTTPKTFTINDNCKLAPICPTLKLNTITSTAAGNKCPGDVINLCIDTTANGSKNLPNGGIIEWYKGTTSTFNPYTTGTLIDTSKIVYAGGIKAPGGAGLASTCSYISGIFVDACGAVSADEADNEFVVMQTGSTAVQVNNMAIGFPGGTTDVTAANNTDFTNAFVGTVSVANLQPAGCPSLLQVVTNGGTIPANATIILFPSSGLKNTYDFNNFCSFGTIYVLIHNQDLSSATFANYNTLSTSDGRSTYVDFGEGCGGKSYTYRRIPTWTTNNDGDYISFGAPDGTTQTSAGGTIATASNANQTTTNWQNNGCATPNFVAPPKVNCKSYTIPASECNNGGNLFFKAIVKPIDPSCSQTDATTAQVGPFTVTCPTATITGSGSACAVATVPLTVDFAGYSGAPSFTINYAIDGIPQAPIITTSDPYILNASTTGIYTVTGVSATLGNCSFTTSGSGSAVVTTQPIVAISGASSVCNGNVVEVPISLSVGNYPVWLSYTFNGVVQPDVQVFSNSFYAPIPAGTADGNYTIELTGVKDDVGCVGTFSGTHTVNIKATPLLTSSFNCSTNTVTLSSSIAGANTFFIDALNPSGALPLPNNNNTGIFVLPVGTTSIVSHINDGTCNSLFTLSNFNCPLALNTTNFSGSKSANGNLLNWIIISRLNIAKIELEFSTNGIMFNSLAVVTNLNNFNHNTNINQAYYRLKITNTISEIFYSNIITLRNNDNLTNDLKILNNPIKNNQLNIQYLSKENKKGTIQIFATDGKLLVNQQINLFKDINILNYNLANLSKGTYLIKLTTNTIKTMNKFIID